MHHSPRTRTLLVIATSMVFSWLASVAEAQRSQRAGAHVQRGGHRASAHQLSAGPTESGFPSGAAVAQSTDTAGWAR